MGSSTGKALATLDTRDYSQKVFKWLPFCPDINRCSLKSLFNSVNK